LQVREEIVATTKKTKEDPSSLVQDETLLLAPPVGVVPIITPPLPPDSVSPGVGIQSPVGAHFSAPKTSEHDTTAPENGPTQLSLFDMPEPHTEVVRRLRLPLAQSSSVEI